MGETTYRTSAAATSRERVGARSARHRIPQAAVDRDDAAGRVAGTVGGEEEGGFGDGFGRNGTHAEEVAAAVFLDLLIGGDPFRRGSVLDHLAHHRGVDEV